jgi:hypothetical protein
VTTEARRASGRAYYAAHREERVAVAAAYRATHREEVRAWNAAYREKHRGALRTASRAYAATHRTERAAYEATYRLTHRAERRVSEAALRMARREERKRIETYVVYAGPEVVYVGRTDHFDIRSRRHRAVSPWFDVATDIDHRYHATYGDSLVDEALLIRLHQPKYNLVGVTR